MVSKVLRTDPKALVRVPAAPTANGGEVEAEVIKEFKRFVAFFD
jgi:hypothetical protein